MFETGAAEPLKLNQAPDDVANFAATGLDAASAQRPRRVSI